LYCINENVAKQKQNTVL